ncbi:histidine phosphatase family protein [Nocardia sp. NPDC004568]|uniref:histidine phosphatase family protein n=1 Tax=Nocardia sp. NPDC004568 TaxID=3154551 RepID=UPI0033A7C09C
MRTVHVVTHPEATHHVDRVVGGWYDSRLTATGERDAEAVAEAVRSRIPHGADVELFSSDLRRTAQTAAVIGAALDLTPVYDARLREKSYGEAGGRPQQWLDRRFVPPARDR